MEEIDTTEGLTLISKMYFNMALNIERSPNYNLSVPNENVENYYFSFIIQR